MRDIANKAIEPSLAMKIRDFNYWLARDIGGGIRPWKLSWIINFQKLGSFFFFGALMMWYADKTPAATSTAAWIYLALHGTYGLVWMVKDMAFPDPGWQERATVLGGLNAFFFVLAPYWAFGWLLISGTTLADYPLPGNIWFALCITLCILGCVIMIAADAQKYFTLRIQKGLITDGVHRYIRHPNYLGEMMIYASFALLVWHWIPVVILAYVWLGIFYPNILCKEASMSRYSEWKAYTQRSWKLIPGVH